MSELSTSILIKNVRLSYPALWKPQPPKNPSGTPRWTASFILDKEKHKSEIALIKSTINQIVNGHSAWKDKTVNFKKIEFQNGGPRAQLVELAGICLRDGAEKADKEGYGPDVMFISAARSTVTKKGAALQPPLTVGKNGETLTEESMKIYAGCYVHAKIRLYAQDGERNGVNADLIGVMLAGDGESFGNGPTTVEQEFGDVIESEFSEPAKTAAPAGDDW